VTKKVVSVFVRFRAPLHQSICAIYLQLSTMKQLVEILDKNKYKKNKIQDYQDTTSFDKSKINVAGNFILDTGASNSCIGKYSV
jgi:hypothetical protein